MLEKQADIENKVTNCNKKRLRKLSEFLVNHDTGIENPADIAFGAYKN
jgi:hypothetical protein